MASNEEVAYALGCFTTHKHECRTCIYNPHPGRDWVYGCIMGQNQIIEEAQEKLRKKARLIIPADFEMNPDLDPKNEIIAWQTVRERQYGWKPVYKELVEYYHGQDQTGIRFWTARPSDKQIKEALKKC